MLERMWRNGNPLALLVGMQTGLAALESSVEVPQKIKNKTIPWPSNCTTRYLSTGYRCAVSKGHMHPMFIAARSTVAKVWEEPKCPSMDEWRKKMWSIYTTEYHSAIKKNEILPMATSWMELEGIMLSEMSQSETDKNHMTSLIWLQETKQMIIREEKQK